MSEREPWTGDDEATIAAVIATAILGGRQRVELTMTPLGQIARLTIAHRLMTLTIGKALLPVMRGVAESMRRIVNTTPALTAGRYGMDDEGES